jgi:ribosome biogenesis GTPase / thiamine phosphate phosphatase
MGVPVIELALKTAPDGARARLAALLAGRTTLVLGPSGSGKSTLINLLVPLADAQVGEISQALQAGRHTTTGHALVLAGRDAPRRADRFTGLPGVRPAPDRAGAAGHADARPARAPGRLPLLQLHAPPGAGLRRARGRRARRDRANRWRIYGEIHEELTRTRW